MLSFRRSLAAVAMLLLSSLAGVVRAQAPVVVKFPGGSEVIPFGPGRFQAFSGGTIRWHVVYDNTRGISDVIFNYFDVMDPLGVATCDGGTPCVGAEFLELLCTGGDAPDPDNGTVLECDPVLGRLDVRNVTVPPGQTSCIQFSTRILDGARGIGGVQNIGCVNVLSPIPTTVQTRPTTAVNPACFPAPGGALTTGCALVNVPDFIPPRFTNRKTAAVADTNANGITDIGDEITWTVEIRNEGTQPQDAYLYDPLPAGNTFIDILDNPDGACTWDAGRGMIDCTVLSFAGLETKTLRFRSSIDCDVFTDDDTSRACNTSYLCGDPGHTSCAPSDEDLASPFLPTCIDVPLPDFTGATKAWSLAEDSDGDGALSDGDLIRFNVVLRNNGSATAVGVVITDVLDTTCLDEATIDTGAGLYNPATDTMTWLAGDIAPGGIEQTQITARVIDTGTPCCNQASITHDSREACGLPPILTDDPATPADDDATCLEFGPQPLVRIEKDYAITTDVNGDGRSDPGDTLTFTITVVNVGGGLATDIVVDDILLPCWQDFVAADVAINPPAAGTNESTELLPPTTPNRVLVTGIGGADGLEPLGAEVVTITFSVTYQPGGLAGCCNEADLTYAESPVTESSDDPSTGFVGDATCTTRENQDASLEVTKTATEAVPDGCLLPGEYVTFTLDVWSRGAESRVVQLSDAITDDDSVFDVIDPGTGALSPAGDSISWTLGDIVQDGNRLVTWIGRFACEAVSGQFIQDVATAAALNAPSSSSAPVTNTVSTPKLVVGKTFAPVDVDSSGTLTSGDQAVFTITVENVGDCAASSVSILDDVDPDLDFTTVVADGSPAFAAGRLTWDETTTPELASLAPLSSVTYVVRATVLEPGPGNPNTGFDGIVTNQAHATAAAAPSCPLRTSSPVVSGVIDVSTAAFELQLTSSNDDLDACHEPGEPVTFTIDLTPRDGAAENARLVLSLDDPLDILTVTDPDGGTVAGNPETITWDLGALPADVAIQRIVVATVRCDVPDAQSFGVRADATSTNLGPAFAELLDLRSASPVLRVTKGFTWVDDGNATLDPGETVKYDILVENIGSCQVRNIDVVDLVDPDLDRTAVTLNPIGIDDGAGSLTWSGLGLDVGASLTLTLEAPVLDPVANPDPTSNGYLDNSASAVATSLYGCPPIAFTGDAPQAQIGATVGTFQLLRNDFITCLSDALATMRAELLRPRPDPQECSEPPAIDPAHRGTQVVDNAVSPVTFSGDADPASSFARCPQTLVGYGRVLVLYELDDPPPACVVTLRCRKVGGAVEVSW